MSLRNISSLFKKKDHKYKSQDDLINMSAEEIVRIEPNDVSSKIEIAQSNNKLDGVKRRALHRLLAIKRHEKENPSLRNRRNAIINQFLNNEGFSKEVVDKMVDIYKKDMYTKLEMKDIENRLRTLKDLPTKEYTEEERAFKKMREQSEGIYKTPKGGKSRKIRKTKKNHKKSRKSYKKYKK